MNGKKVQKKSRWKIMVILVLLIVVAPFFSHAENNILQKLNDPFRKNADNGLAQNREVSSIAISEEALHSGYDQVFSDRGLWDASNVDFCLDRIAYLRVFDDDGVEHIEKIEFGYRNGSVEEIECSFYCSTANIESDKIADFIGGERAFYETTYGEPDNATVRSTHVMDYCIVQVTYKELNKSDYARAVFNTLECYGPGLGNAANGGNKISVPSGSDYPGWYIKQIPGI